MTQNESGAKTPGIHSSFDRSRKHTLIERLTKGDRDPVLLRAVRTKRDLSSLQKAKVEEEGRGFEAIIEPCSGAKGAARYAQMFWATVVPGDGSRSCDQRSGEMLL